MSAQNTLVGEFALTGIERAKAGVPKFEIEMVCIPAEAAMGYVFVATKFFHDSSFCVVMMPLCMAHRRLTTRASSL